MAEKQYKNHKMEEQQGLCLLYGLLVPEPVADQEHIEKLRNFKLYPDDVWVASYPKSGTTWTQQIVRLIRNNGEEDSRTISEAVPWLEGLKQYPEVNMDELPRPRAFKVHFPYDLLPCGPPHTTPCKYIYVMRNPKDLAVSCYFYYKTLFNKTLEWNGFWKDFLAGNVIYGNYFDHVLSWWSHRDEENILFLKYEDMKKDLRRAVSQITSFIDADLSDGVLDKIVRLTTFDNMKDDKSANFSWCPLHYKEGGTEFLRKGSVGDWRNYFSVNQSNEMGSIIDERLGGTGIEFEYD